MKLTIAFKMSLGLLVMLLLMIVPGAAGVTAARTMRGLTSALADKHDESRAIWTIKVAVIKTSAALGDAVEIGTEGEIATAHFWHSELEARTEHYKNISAGGKAELAQRLETSHLEFNDLYEEVRGKLQARKPVNREEFDERMDKAVKDYTTVLDDLQSEVDKSMESALEEAGRTQTRTLSLVAGFTTAAAILGAALAWGITRSVTRPVRRLVEVADNISMGDLDLPIEVTSRDEIGELQESIERMRVSLKTALERLKKQR
ncbi:MAG: HAMP domain-containing protein [Anaerolineales bacterium]|nr:MAG: HAMP domain-containing protein [Anaerolineales bacterium]TEU17856.1 MAG: HAMP domain-containing protein [Anaerolineales bacterium]